MDQGKCFAHGIRDVDGAVGDLQQGKVGEDVEEAGVPVTDGGVSNDELSHVGQKRHFEKVIVKGGDADFVDGNPVDAIWKTQWYVCLSVSDATF